MVHRTGGSRGNAVIDIRIKGFGRFRCSAQTIRAGAVARRKEIARLLGELGQFDVLRAVLAGELAWGQLEHAQRQQRLANASLAADLKLKRNLAQAIAETLPRMGPTETTRTRYRVALVVGLAQLGLDTSTMTVAELKRDDWRERLAAWESSPATRNGVRTAVSAFLSRFLGDVYHPFRREVLHRDRWPRLKVPHRVKGFAAAEFWPLMRLIPERLVPSCVVLAASGMRIGEYLHASIRADEEHHVIETTGKTGPKVYAVDPEAWAYVRAAVPCRASRMTKVPTRLQNDPRYKAIYRAVRHAGAQLGLTISPHDLRRLYVRLGVDAKGQIATQHAVGHETPAMTAEYARAQSQADVASAVAQGLGLVAAPDVSGKKSGNMGAADGRRRTLKRGQR